MESYPITLGRIGDNRTNPFIADISPPHSRIVGLSKTARAADALAGASQFQDRFFNSLRGDVQ